MRFSTLLLLLVIGFATVAHATVPVPTNLKVTRGYAPNGSQQFFTITWYEPIYPRDGTRYYSQLIRWNGVAPDTTMRAVLQAGSPYDTTGYYNDYDVRLPRDKGDSTGAYVYSYAVRTVQLSGTDSAHPIVNYSAFDGPVFGSLDTALLHFVNQPGPQTTLQLGTTFHYTFTAQSTQGAVVRYYLNVLEGPAQAGIDSTTGAFWLTPIGFGMSYVQISATDNAGRQVQATYVFYVATITDTLMLVMKDSLSGKFLPSGTRCYVAITSPQTDTAGISRTSMNECDSGGVLYLACDSGSTIRMQALGYRAVDVTDPKGHLTIGESGRVFLTLLPATAHTFRGQARTRAYKPIAGVTVLAYFADPNTYPGYSAPFATTTTDSYGEYVFTGFEGDSILGTNQMAVQGIANDYADSPQWYNVNGNFNSPKLITIDHNQDSIDFWFSQAQPRYVGRVRVQVVDEAQQQLYVFYHATAYRLSDSGITTFNIDSADWRTNADFTIPLGKYIFFAEKTDWGNGDTTRFLSGYYKKGEYAAAWGDADTIDVNDSMLRVIAIVLLQDSSVAHQTGGTPIDGVVHDSHGPLANTHLLLYQTISAPAGSPVTRKLITTAVTDVSGNYSFPDVVRGTYSILVDIVGAPSYEIDGVVVDGSGAPVHKDVTVGASAVGDNVSALPGVMQLAQNYPNPFSSSTTIAFDVATRGAVDLAIYDMSGRLVRTLVHGDLTQGSYRTEVRGDLHAGVYTCVLRSAGTVATRLISVVR